MVKMESVWNAMADFLRAHKRALLPIVLLGLFVPLTIGQLAEMVQAETGSETAPGIAASLISFLVAVIALWAQISITAMALEPLSAGAAARTGLRRLPAVIGILVLVTIVLMVLALPVLFVFWRAGMGQGVMHAPDVSPLYLAFVVLYAIVYAVALVVLIARLIVTTPVIVAERNGLSALRRSWQLTRGYGAAIIGIVLLFGIVALIAQLAVKTVLGSILLLFLGGEGSFSLSAILIACASGIVLTIVSVIQFAFLAKLYLALSRPFRSEAASFE